VGFNVDERANPNILKEEWEVHFKKRERGHNGEPVKRRISDRL